MPRRTALPAPEAVLFDAGGTLIHMHPEPLGDLLGPITGVRPTREEIAAAHYRAMHDMAGEVAGGSWQDADWVRWIRVFLVEAGVPDHPEAVASLGAARGLFRDPIPGAVEAVHRLRAAGVRVAVVSNAFGTVESALTQAGFGGLFEFVLDSSLVGVAKPDAAIFALAAERLGVPPEHTWHVGDSMPHDVAGARAAGLAAAILIDPLDLEPGHHPRVAGVADLPALLGLGG